MNKKLLGRIAAILFAALLALSPVVSVVAHAAPIASRPAVQRQSVDSDSTFWDRLMGRTELTEYEKQQQELPLSQRDRKVAEPGLLALALVILVWFVWKIRRDIKKIKKDNEEYDRQRAEIERQLAEMKDDEDEEESEAGDWEEIEEEIPTVEAELVEDSDEEKPLES